MQPSCLIRRSTPSAASRFGVGSSGVGAWPRRIRGNWAMPARELDMTEARVVERCVDRDKCLMLRRKTGCHSPTIASDFRGKRQSSSPVSLPAASSSGQGRRTTRPAARDRHLDASIALQPSVHFRTPSAHRRTGAPDAQLKPRTNFAHCMPGSRGAPDRGRRFSLRPPLTCLRSGWRRTSADDNKMGIPRRRVDMAVAEKSCRSKIPVHSTHVGQIVRAHYHWHRLHRHAARVVQFEERASGWFVRVEGPSGEVRLVSCWMPDATVCANLQLGVPQVSVSALVELQARLTDSGSDENPGSDRSHFPEEAVKRQLRWSSATTLS